MKKFTLLVILVIVGVSSIFAQKGGNSIVLVNKTIIVSSGTAQSIASAQVHTIEMWVKPVSVTNDQKLFNKIRDDYSNGYILGIANGEVVYEVFDNAGKSDVIYGGPIAAGEWTHIAAVYSRGDKQEIFLNGRLAASKTPVQGFVSNIEEDLVIGAESKSRVSKMFIGEIDEIRFWNTWLPDTTIRSWMYKNCNSSLHPKIEQLGLYLKCDEASGSTLNDLSKWDNFGITNGTRSISSIPFKGSNFFAGSYQGGYSGVWKGQPTDTVDELIVRGQGLFANQPTIIEASEDGSTTLCGYASLPTSADMATCRIWHAVHYGNPTLEFEFDLSAYDLTAVSMENVVLCQSEIYGDFKSAKIIQGSVNGTTFTTNSFIALSPNLYYYVGFVNKTASVQHLPYKSKEIKVFPNPTSGEFNLELDLSNVDVNKITIMDITGKLIVDESVTEKSNELARNYDLSNYPKGVYNIAIYSSEGISNRRVLVQ